MANVVICDDGTDGACFVQMDFSGNDQYQCPECGRVVTVPEEV